jgi:hypothetical protein
MNAQIDLEIRTPAFLKGGDNTLVVAANEDICTCDSLCIDETNHQLNGYCLEPGYVLRRAMPLWHGGPCSPVPIPKDAYACACGGVYPNSVSQVGGCGERGMGVELDSNSLSYHLRSAMVDLRSQ